MSKLYLSHLSQKVMKSCMTTSHEFKILTSAAILISYPFPRCSPFHHLDYWYFSSFQWYPPPPHPSLLLTSSSPTSFAAACAIPSVALPSTRTPPLGLPLVPDEPSERMILSELWIVGVTFRNTAMRREVWRGTRLLHFCHR